MMPKLTFPKTSRNELSNNPFTTAVARALSAHATVVTDGFAMTKDENFYEISI